MAFNNWPYTNFQDLNLGWILSTYKTALNKALEALGKANAVEATVGTYTDSINTATLTANQASATANQAMNIARNANEVLFISADAEDKAVNYVTWSQGVSGYVTASDIYNAIVVDRKVPIFMDRMQYVYEMAGYETDPNSPLTITRFKFTRNGGNRENIVWIDSAGSITYTHVDGGANGFPVVFNYIPQNPELSESGYWDSDKTYAEILAAINSGKSIFLTVKIDGETRELINNAYISKSSSGTYIALGYSRGFDIYDSPYYTNTENLLVYYTINSSEFISVQRVFTVPSSSTQITGRVLTVNSSGKAEWLPASGGGGSYSPYLIPVTEIGGVYSTAVTGYDVFEHILDCRIISNGLYYYPIGAVLSGAFGHAYFACSDPSPSGKFENVIFDVNLDGNNVCTVTRYEKDINLNPETAKIIISASSSSIPPIEPNKFYLFSGDASSLNIALATPSNSNIANEYHFMFTSGSTPTTLSIPSTVKQPDGFAVEANHIYEVSILENCMTAQGWAVTP